MTTPLLDAEIEKAKRTCIVQACRFFRESRALIEPCKLRFATSVWEEMKETTQTTIQAFMKDMPVWSDSKLLAIAEMVSSLQNEETLELEMALLLDCMSKQDIEEAIQKLQ